MIERFIRNHPITALMVVIGLIMGVVGHSLEAAAVGIGTAAIIYVLEVSS